MSYHRINLTRWTPVKEPRGPSRFVSLPPVFVPAVSSTTGLFYFLSFFLYLPSSPLFLFLAHMYIGRSDFKERKRKPMVGRTTKKKTLFLAFLLCLPGFSGGSVVKNPPANAGDTWDMGSIHGSGRSPGEGNDNPLQCSCLEIPKDRGAWWATVHGVAKSQTQLNDWKTAQLPGLHKHYSHCAVCFSVEKRKRRDRKKDSKDTNMLC